MQVNVIDGGRQAFNTMLYNIPNSNTLTWLNNNINTAKAVLSGVADSVIEATNGLYNKVNNSAVINAAKALITEQGGHTNQHVIYGLDYNNMYDANYIMQQYIMANPVIQQLHQDNMCYGFEETYYDAQPGVTGVDRLDYQRVMDGVVQEDGGDLVIKHYSNLDDIELPVTDQFLILETWAHAENMILNDMDPTDPNQSA